MSTWVNDYFRRVYVVDAEEAIPCHVYEWTGASPPIGAHMQSLTDAEHLMLKQLEAITAQLQRIVTLLEGLARR